MVNKAKKTEDSIEFDLTGLKKGFTRKIHATADYFEHKPKLLSALLILVLLIVSMGFSYSVRNNSADLEITSSWAAQSINNAVRNQALSIVREQYPSLSGPELESRVNEVASTLKLQAGDSLAQQTLDQGNYFKERLQLEMPDGSQQTYLLAIDSWQYYRLTGNYLENGHNGDILKDGVPWNDHMLAPNGRKEKQNFHVIFSAFWHKIFKIFNPDAVLLQSFFWVPVVVSMLAVIPAFFIVYRKTNYLGGFIAAMMVAVHPYFLTRTAAGFSDTDAYNVFFPLLITWLVIEAFETNTVNKKMIFGGLAGLTVGIFSFAWSGWWYIFDFMIVGLLGYIYFIILEKKLTGSSWDWKYKVAYFLTPFIGVFLYLSISNFIGILGLLIALAWGIYLLYDAIKLYLSKKEKDFKQKVKHALISFASFFVASGIFVSIFTSFSGFLSAFTRPLGFSAIQESTKANLWPNVYTTVAELNQANIAQIVSNIGLNISGGKFFFFLAILGIAFSFLRHKLTSKDWTILGSTIILSIIILQNINSSTMTFIVLMSLPAILGIYFSLGRDIDVKYALIITVWFIGTIYAATLGIRFILLMVPVFAVALGIGFGQVFAILQKYLTKEFKLKNSAQIVLGIILFVLLASFLLRPVQAGQEVGRSEVPSFDDAWWESLKAIETDSQPDAIINSWWDFGHWFKAVADRAVTFDGASQNTPQAHWIGRALSAETEEETIGILRMLDCGGTLSYDYLVNEGMTSIGAISTLKEIILVKETEAKEILEAKGVKDTDAVLEKTHCAPPENYFITSGDMVGKSGVWSHFGSWDFNKAYIYNAVKNNDAAALSQASELTGLDEEQVQDYIFTAKGLSDDAANYWIGPFDGYLASGSRISCSGNETVLCKGQLQLSLDSRGINVLEQININTEDYATTTVQIGLYDRSTGQRLGGDVFVPKGIVVADETMYRVDTESSDSGFDVVFDVDKNTAFLAGPAVGMSTFTKLFFFNGEYTEQFELLSDKTAVTGNRILVWKVNW